MSISRKKSLIFLAVLAVIIGLACNAVTGPATTELPPTQPPPTQPPPTSPPPTLAPTMPPEPTSPPADPAPTATPAEAPPASGLILSDTLYQHPRGIFEFYPPAGWEITDEDEGSVWFEAADFSGAIYLEVTNTVIPLDGPSFERFLDARDANRFSTYEGYREVDREVDQANGTATVVKELVFDGVPQTVVTYYDQHEHAIYVLDYWADADIFEEYAEGYDSFFNNVVIDTEAAAEQVEYYWVYEFYGPNNLFVIEVPTSWRYEMTSGDSTLVETFYSPDEHAVIQSIAYDDGTPISQSEAGKFALELLRNFYADDIRITGDKVQPDGSERLTWNSPGGEFSGITFFETRGGTTALLFSVLYDNPYEDVYIDTLDYAISSYTIP